MKITDKLSLRATALKLAVESDCVGLTVDNTIQRAKAFEIYIQGDVKLPDFMPIPDISVSVNVCNGCGEEYDDDDKDEGIGLN